MAKLIKYLVDWWLNTMIGIFRRMNQLPFILNLENPGFLQIHPSLKAAFPVFGKAA
jgi:hypothetical protein